MISLMIIMDIQLLAIG